MKIIVRRFFRFVDLKNSRSQMHYSYNSETTANIPSMASDRFTPSKYIAKKQPETQQVAIDISESISQIPNQDALITHTDRG